MITQLFLKNRLRHALTEREKAVLDQAIGKQEVLEPRHILIHKGELVERSTYLIDGFMLRYIDGIDGDRQIVCVHVPGDFVDLHGFAMKRLDHDVAALEQATVGFVQHDVLQDIMDKEPHLARILWFSTMLDAATHREWLFRLGRLNAEAKLAHLICELHQRMAFVDLYDDTILRIPLTQQDIAQICGLTPVHVNRVAASLREKNLATLHRPVIEIHNLEKLQELAQFDGQYLYGQGPLRVGHELDLGQP